MSTTPVVRYHVKMAVGVRNCRLDTRAFVDQERKETYVR